MSTFCASQLPPPLQEWQRRHLHENQLSIPSQTLIIHVPLRNSWANNGAKEAALKSLLNICEGNYYIPAFKRIHIQINSSTQVAKGPQRELELISLSKKAGTFVTQHMLFSNFQI